MKATCEINKNTVSQGIMESASGRMKMSGLFDYEEDDFFPKSEDSGYQSFINSINKDFGEEIVMRIENPLDISYYTIIEPSESLVNKYLSNAKPLFSPKKLPQAKLGEVISQTAGTGICDGTCGLMVNRLQEANMPYASATIPDKHANYHAVAVTEFRGKRYIVDQPQVEFIGREKKDNPVWESALYWRGMDLRFNRHFPRSLNDIAFAMDMNPIGALFGSIEMPEEYGGEKVGPFFKDRNEFSIGEDEVTIIEGVSIENPSVKIRIRLPLEEKLEDQEFENLSIYSYKQDELIPTWTSEDFEPRMIEATEENLMSQYQLNEEQANIAVGRIREAKINKDKDKVYLSASVSDPVKDDTINENQWEELSIYEDEDFVHLQNMGLISMDSTTVNGITYYKIPETKDGQRDWEKKDRLEQIIHSKKLRMINIIYGGDNFLIRLGEPSPAPTRIDAPTLSSRASSITKGRVLSFLDNIGFRNIQTVSDIVYKGTRLQANAYVDFANGVMKIRDGAEDHVFPEEAMTILLELIKESRPQLYEEMLAQVVNYKLYRDVVNDPSYANNPLYKDEDGNIDYNKIKHEAVTKLLTEYLINRMEGTAESKERIEQAFSWWHQIMRWIRELFGQYKNPFKQALDELDVDDTTFGEFTDISSGDIYLSAKSNEEIDKQTPDNKALYESIKNRPSQLGIYKVGSDYFKNGVKVSSDKRVTALVDAYYKKLFGDRNFDDALEAFYEQSRKDGTYIHELFEAAINSNIDTSTGLMRRNPKPIDFPFDGKLTGKISVDVIKFVRQFMAQYPQGTRFISEQIIYDAKNDRYGTVDFQAIKPDGTVDIIDWKSMLMQDIEGTKDYKKGAIFIQLNEYKRILKDEYDVEKFGKIRAIPVHKHYKTFPSGNRVLTNVSIGDVDAAKITSDDRRLRPIISPEESTGSESRDETVKYLEALYNKYIEKGYFVKDRNILNDVQEAIYEIRVGNSVENLTNYFIDLRTKFTQLLAEGGNLMKADRQEVSEALALIEFYEDIMENIVQPSIGLQEDKTISKESRNKLFSAASEITFLSNKLKQLRAKLLDEQAKKEGIFDLLKPEKVANFLVRTFRTMGNQDIATVRYMYELTKKSYNRIDLETDDKLKELKELKFAFDKWKKDRNVSSKEAIGTLVNFDKGRLHSKIDKSFYEKREQVHGDKNPAEIIRFVRENYDTKDYINWYNSALAENKKVWESSVYDTNKKKNALIIRNKIETFEKNYNIFTHPVTAFGYHNPRVWSRNVKEEKWYSENYKNLLKAENKPLLDMYNFFVARNKDLAEVGAIKDYEAYTFLPNVRKSLADLLSFEDGNILEKSKNAIHNVYKNWRASVSVEDYEMNYQGARDSFTGEKLNKRFVPFVSKVDEKSFDVFTIYGLMTKEIYKEKYLQENDELIRALIHIEKAKPALLENKYGVVDSDSQGRPVVSKELGKNLRILEEHVRHIVNGESLQYDADYVIQFRLRDKWNSSPLGKLYKFDVSPETYKPTSVSLTKFILWLNTANQKRILGLNAASAISNLFGGSFSSSKLFQKYLGKDDLRGSWMKMTSGNFYSTEQMQKYSALVDYFLPLLNNREAFKSSQLSVSTTSQILSQEWIMSPMRRTSEIVQLNIFLALIANTGVIDGKLVNLREQASKDTNYEGRYSDGISPAQRAEIEKAFHEKIKIYKDKYSLEKVAKFVKVTEAGKQKTVIEIPGVDRNSEAVSQLREITQTMAKDSLGEADEFDLANYKYSIGWRLFMTFKNWIPRMADVRFGEFRYSQAHHAHEYGRIRMFAKSLSASYAQTVLKLIPIPFLTSKVTGAMSQEALIQRAKEVYQEKKERFEKLGKYDPETFITQGEFVDRFLQGTEATFAELRTLTFMMALLFFGITAPDDDDDAETKGIKSLARKQINKLIDEVGFFYSPKSGIDIAGGGAPVFSIIRDGWYLMTDLSDQFFGYSLEQIGLDEKGVKMQERAKPVKRLFKMFPVLKEILTYLPAIDNETAKDWGVKISDRRSF
jgi:hypothetical protein